MTPKEQAFSDKLIERERLFVKIKELMEIRAERSLALLNSDDFYNSYNEFISVNKYKREINDFYSEFIDVLSALVFFPNEELLEVLKRYGVNQTITDYFISVELIKKEIDIINGNNLTYLNPIDSLIFIEFYLLEKLRANAISLYFETMSSGVSNRLIEFYLSNNRAMKRYLELNQEEKLSKFQLNFHDEINARIDELKKLLTAEEQDMMDLKGTKEKIIRKELRGGSDLRMLINISIRKDEKLNIQNYYFQFYNLLKLLMPNQELAYEDDGTKAYSEKKTVAANFYTNIIRKRFKILE